MLASDSNQLDQALSLDKGRNASILVLLKLWRGFLSSGPRVYYISLPAGGP